MQVDKTTVMERNENDKLYFRFYKDIKSFNPMDNKKYFNENYMVGFDKKIFKKLDKKEDNCLELKLYEIYQVEPPKNESECNQLNKYIDDLLVEYVLKTKISKRYFHSYMDKKDCKLNYYMYISDKIN